MATIIQTVNNESDTPVAYLGTADGGWASQGFAPDGEAGFDWKIIIRPNPQDPPQQALLTKGGVFYIWDNGNWTILYQKAGSSSIQLLTQVQGPGNPEITLTVGPDGTPSATQNDSASGTASGNALTAQP
jgi:hypothetical protein